MAIRDLAMGMSGPDVKAVQDALNVQPGLKSPRLDPDGVFGPKTDAKVREFQALKHLKVDGIVGKCTRLALFPVGVATVTIVGVSRPTPPSRGKPVDLDALRRHVENSPIDVAPVQIPGAKQPLIARIFPDHILGFDYDHMEAVPGSQVTLPGPYQNWGWGSGQDAFSFTLQSIYQRGPDDGHNRTLTGGLVLTKPVTWFGGQPAPLTGAGFIQLTDVDWFWRVGHLHLVQPYAQVGAQANFSSPHHLSLTGALFPVNIGYDVNDDVSLQLGMGLTGTLDLSNREFTVGRQATFGVSIKFGRPNKPKK